MGLFVGDVDPFSMPISISASLVMGKMPMLR